MHARTPPKQILPASSILAASLASCAQTGDMRSGSPTARSATSDFMNGFVVDNESVWVDRRESP